MEAQTNGTKLSQKMKPHIYSQLISNKDVKVDKKERYFQCKKMDMNMQKKVIFDQIQVQQKQKLTQNQ